MEYIHEFGWMVKRQEGKMSENVIIFIDEIHTLVGAGGASGSLDASNMFKPSLARGDIHCIGATTMDEYRKYIEKDGALDRRFQKITINPPSIEESIEILIGLKENYEEHHKVHAEERLGTPSDALVAVEGVTQQSWSLS